MSSEAGPVKYWRCPNCGQVHFGDSPPDMCDFCRDFTTWQLLVRQTQQTAPDDRNAATVQLPLFTFDDEGVDDDNNSA